MGLGRAGQLAIDVHGEQVLTAYVRSPAHYYPCREPKVKTETEASTILFSKSRMSIATLFAPVDAVVELCHNGRDEETDILAYFIN